MFFKRIAVKITSGYFNDHCVPIFYNLGQLNISVHCKTVANGSYLTIMPLALSIFSTHSLRRKKGDFPCNNVFFFLKRKGGVFYYRLE